MQAVHRGDAQHGSAWFAMEQTAGRGQRGKTWFTEPGENIILSVVIDPVRYAISKPFVLNWCFSLAACELFDKYTMGGTTIKWPNDIYWRDRKAAGILIENVYRGDNWAYSVAGMGMNINQVNFPETTRKPVSLKQITGKDFNPLDLCDVFFELLEKQLELLRKKGANAVLETYNRNLFRKDEKTRLKMENIVFETVITGVNNAGQLCTRDSIDRYFDFGQIEWML